MISGDLPTARTEPANWRARIAAVFIALACAGALASIFVFPGSAEVNRLEAGQVSARAILAPGRITYASDIETREAQSKAQATVKDIFDPPNPERTRAQVSKTESVLDFVDTVRHDSYSDPEKKVKLLLVIPDLNLSALTISRTLALDDNVFHRVVSETLYMVDSTMRDEIRAADINAALAKLPTRVSLGLSTDQAELVAQWARPFIVPNSFYSATKTEDVRAAERDRVGTVYRTIEKGEAVVREGEVITPLAIESLEEFHLVTPRRESSDVLGGVLFAGGLTILLGVYIVRSCPSLIAHPRALALVAFLVIGGALAARSFALEQRPLAYVLPFSVGAMLVAVLIDSQTAFGVALALALIVGFLAQNSFELAAYVLAGSWVAAASLGRVERLSAFWWRGLYVAGANGIAVIIFRVLAHETDLVSLAPYAIAALVNAVLVVLIALGSLAFLGRIFGITTSLDLLELTRPTHPLLKKLLAEAPGTYHHSLIVGQLAEQAAQTIGADAMLVRVAAYYHDVGKTRDPQSFVENQFDGVNMHDSLDPQTSAGVVIDHVQRGIALAEKYGLPPRIREMIPQHHGTTLAAFFHHKAKENGNVRVDENDFRYVGPKPQSREAGILMLADGTEATARAERPTTPEQIRAIIDRIVDDRLRDGQLNESNLTLRDIQQIKEAFFGVLQGMFHARVKYPVEKPANVIRLEKHRGNRDSRS